LLDLHFPVVKKMNEFLTLLPPNEALTQFLSNVEASPKPQLIHTKQALGRITMSAVLAPHPLPEFSRSTVDGFAVRAADTYGAGESLPAYLDLIGEVPMGGSPDFKVEAAQCGLIHTGGMIPECADAVVMVEYTQGSRPGEIEILRPVAVGENIIAIGEDVQAGSVVIPGGTRLRPAEIGGLMALGITQIEVAQLPKVGILSSGDEVISPERQPVLGQVRDVNTYSLSALVENAGGVPVCYGIIPDRQDAMLYAARRAKAECDLVVITAGSSASTRDLTATVINQLGDPGVLVHGVNIRPGKPTILAVCEGVAMIGLPGNPVSALVIAGLFVVPLIKKLLGERLSRPPCTIPARLAINLSSQAGREEWVPVRLVEKDGEYLAEPVFGLSNLIFTLARADGQIRIPPDDTGLSAGEIVNVFLI
jgi:molybdopterin molybdotransferase